MCKVCNDLVRFHRLIDQARDMLSEDERAQAEAAGRRVIGMLNDTCPSHGAKLLALMGAIGVGLDHIEQDMNAAAQTGVVGHA
jgi:hypothetical protein